MLRVRRTLVRRRIPDRTLRQKGPKRIMGIVQEQRIKMDSKDLRRPDGHGGKEAGVICKQCCQPLEEWEAGICEGCGMKQKPTIVCECNNHYVFAGSVNDCYRCPKCRKWNPANATGMQMMDVNDVLSFRAAVSSLWWKYRTITEAAENAMTSIPICDSPSLSVSAAKAILSNLGNRDTETEEKAIESYLQRWYS
jgi:hypothetical protein